MAPQIQLMSSTSTTNVSESIKYLRDPFERILSPYTFSSVWEYRENWVERWISRENSQKLQRKIVTVSSFHTILYSKRDNDTIPENAPVNHLKQPSISVEIKCFYLNNKYNFNCRLLNGYICEIIVYVSSICK